MAAEDGDQAVGCPSPSGRPTPAGIEAVLTGFWDFFITAKKDVKPGERQGEMEGAGDRWI